VRITRRLGAGLGAGVGAVLLLAAPAAAVPITETLGLTESLTVVVIHGGPACSSGWQPDASGACVDETGAPPAWLPVLDAPVVSLEAAAADPAPVPNPEPSTLLLVGSTLAGLGWIRRRSRTPRSIHSAIA